MLSERERKLMRWSYEAGFTYGYHCGSEDIPARDGFDDWLNEDAAEGGITVEMVVDTDAGRVILDMKPNELELLAEDLECVQMWLDDKKAPKINAEGKEYSVVGRIQCLLKEIQNE